MGALGHVLGEGALAAGEALGDDGHEPTLIATPARDGTYELHYDRWRRADILGLGLVRLDPGRLFGGTVGESEANLRRLTAAAERLAPVVLWIDELDKGLVGSEGAASDAREAERGGQSDPGAAVHCFRASPAWRSSSASRRRLALSRVSA